MKRNISALPVGHEFATGQRIINAQEVEDYAEAVGGYGRAPDSPQAVPPTALSAYALREILNQIELPGGAVHAGQNMSMKRGVSVGDSVLFEAKLSQNSVRSGWRYLTIEYKVYDASYVELMDGRSTIVIPEVPEEG
tara:strand:- start:4 stop:414 length:411 start_codon:yes stop_codon:yes gene_type:complete